MWNLLQNVIFINNNWIQFNSIKINRFLKQKIDNNCGIHTCLCPAQGCNKQILVSTIDAFLGKDASSALEQQTIKQKMNIFECPGCKATFGIPNEINTKSIQCNSCTKTFCRLCLKLAHKGVCQERKQLIKTMKSMSSAVEVMPCPFCLQLSSKDDHCDHVTCYFCKHDFCFRCSAIRSPTLEHGNHYHRKKCKHYMPYEGKDDKISQKCEKCKELGKLCRPPKDLEDDDIPESEIPANLKF